MAAILALAAGVLVGCGGGGSSPEDTVQGFYDASKDGDAAAACELLSSESQEAAAAQGGDCETAFEQAGAADVPDDLEIGDVTEDGDTATVAVSGDGEESEIPVVKEDDEWRIDLIGASTAPEASGSEDGSAEDSAPEGDATSTTEDGE